MRIILKRHILSAIALSLLISVSIYSHDLGVKALVFSGRTLANFLIAIPPIFICIGLLDVWVDREHMIRIMGDESSFSGILTAFLFGIVTAVPIYALLPIAGVMLKKRCRIENVLIFICSSVSIRIPLVLFEVSSFGWAFTITRLVTNVFIVLFIAWTARIFITDRERQNMYTNADAL